jgi:hypothetical protein
MCSPTDYYPYYDKEGIKISFEEWIAFKQKPDYSVVKQETIGDYQVSTVWLGTNCDYGNTGRPIIFETMVFTDKEVNEHEDLQFRYVNEVEAWEGHKAVVALVKAQDKTHKKEEDNDN